MGGEPAPQGFGGDKVGQGVLGEVAPLAVLGRAEAVAGDHVPAGLRHVGADVGADEARRAGDERQPAHARNRAMTALVEWPSTRRASLTSPP